MNTANLRFVLVTAAVLAAAFVFTRNSAEEKLKKVVYEVVENCITDEPLSFAQIGVRLNDLQTHFNPDVAISATDGTNNHSTIGWNNIKDGFLLGSRLFSKVAVDLSKFKSDIKEKSAELNFEIQAHGADANGESFRELIEATLEFEWQKDRWRISRVEVERRTPE